MQARLLILLLKPSLASVLLAAALALVAIFAANWSYFADTPALYPLFYGEFGVITALERSPVLTHDATTSVSESPIAYGAVICIAALLAGWLAVALVHGIRNDVAAIHSLQDRTRRKDIFEHIAIRLGILAAWAAYATLWYQGVAPFCLLLSRIGAESITSVGGLLLNCGAFAALATSIYVHIVFLRLSLLRPRVFGAKTTIQDITFHPEH